MIPPSTIVRHLQSTLPRFRSDFTDALTATATAAGSTVTITSVGHGLAVGDTLIIGSARFNNALVDAVDNGDGTYRFTTADDHDLTQPQLSRDPTTLTLAGLGAPWDGAHTIRSVPNRRTFEIDDAGSPPMPGGSAVLVEAREAGLKGIQVVAAVNDLDSFTISMPSVPSFPTGAVADLQAMARVRIAQAVDVDRAEEIYTKDPKPYAFVVAGDVNVSKDRNAQSDATAA